jgi:hypothetical protein
VTGKFEEALEEGEILEIRLLECEAAGIKVTGTLDGCALETREAEEILLVEKVVGGRLSKMVVPIADLELIPCVDTWEMLEITTEEVWDGFDEVTGRLLETILLTPDLELIPAEDEAPTLKMTEEDGCTIEEGFDEITYRVLEMIILPDALELTPDADGRTALEMTDEDGCRI